MKNHLSMLGSMGAGWWLSPLGTLMVLGSTRSGELVMVVLVLQKISACDRNIPESNLQSNVALGGLAGNQAVPGLGALADDVHGVPS